MKNHRHWTALAICWLFLLFNIERMIDAVNLASFVYVLSTLVAAAMLLSRPLRRLSPVFTLVPMFALLVVGKCLLGYMITWESLPITLVEAAAIATTQLIARRLGLNTDEFSEATAELVCQTNQGNVRSANEVEAAMQQEMSRARRTGRATTLVHLGVKGDWESKQLQQFLSQMTEELVRQSALSHVGRILLAETKVSDVISHDDGHFSLLLPETSQQQAASLVQRLSTRVREETGLSIRTRSMSFPTDELTLEGLRDRIRKAPYTDELVPADKESETPRSAAEASRRVS